MSVFQFFMALVDKVENISFFVYLSLFFDKYSFFHHLENCFGFLGAIFFFNLEKAMQSGQMDTTNFNGSGGF